MPTLSGAVLLTDAEAATNAVVELHNSGGDVVDQTLVDQTLVDRRGRYTFHVSPETWRVGWDTHGNRWRGVTRVADYVHLELLSLEYPNGSAGLKSAAHARCD